MDVRVSGKVDPKFQLRESSGSIKVLCLPSEPAFPEPDTFAADGGAGGGGAAAGAGGGAGGKGRKQERLTTATHGRVKDEGAKIGGAFTPEPNPSFHAQRAAVYDRIMADQRAALEAKPRSPIVVTLPDGNTKEGTAWETTPLDIASSISKSLAKKVIVAKVTYESRDGRSDGIVNTGPEDSDEEEESKSAAELWDVTRPLEGNCLLELKTFADPEGKMVFWHSSAHVLGEALECQYGCKLCIGPPTQEGFYYDAYMGSVAITEKDYPKIKKKAEEICQKSNSQRFERIVLTKPQALELFADNPFKVALISAKIPDGGMTTAYRCGPLIDLCMGPHVPETGYIQAFEVMNNSAAYWLGQQTNDSLQRVYGVSFPDKKLLKAHLKMLEEAKKRDHRVLGEKHELFFFHPLSPGSAFFLPHGAHLYNKLMDHIKHQYRIRGYTEVVTPNVFNLDLWHTSGHAEHYLENMFTFDVEGAQYGLKPMNCPGHCLMFAHRLRSYRELPIRLADFGVLHRNEFSGALTGLTRVRRFQQDDAHIFCRMDQIEEEVAGVLDFMDYTYSIFGFTYELNLSTRPKKALGARELWDKAEAMMKGALDRFGKPWRINAGDGAFYGPKIDIRVFDALGRPHQCATIQLDFQLPIRFKLKYKGGTEASAEGEAGPVAGAGAAGAPAGDSGLGVGFDRPVIIHRAILGSVERMLAVLIEHTEANWPLWLSPKQVCVVPVGAGFYDYARSVQQALFAAGFQADVDDSSKQMNNKIRLAQVARYNFVFVVGPEEMSSNSVNIRARDNSRLGVKTLDEAIGYLKGLVAEHK